MKFFNRESAKLKYSAVELRRRRLNWRAVTKKQIECKFKEAMEFAKVAEYPFSLFCNVEDSSINEGSVQLHAGSNMTGVVERVDTHTKKSNSCVSEKGSGLVASFSITGAVTFIVYPYKSDRYARNEENIILYMALSPNDVNDKLIEKCICKYLLYTRKSSIYGAHSNSLVDTIKINWMLLVDVRNRKKLHQGFRTLFIEWSKLVGAGIIGYIVAVLSRNS